MNVLVLCRSTLSYYYQSFQQCSSYTFFSILAVLLYACSSSVRFATTTIKASTDEQTTARTHSPTSYETTETVFVGLASYYGNEFHGRPTASGERYNQHELSAAHRTLPFGTMVRVRNLDNNKSVIVRINDRGPWKQSRILDVSLAAAEALDMTRSGTAKVEITVLR
ncbi:MAG: septal ring lytic transglycosylase RlpA family protein [Candidatus Kapabacteria bacterium]|nr:septal ring lytic transglycosylase RlpA family protein [Candidatus Kapabacteria bacterium]